VVFLEREVQAFPREHLDREKPSEVLRLELLKPFDGDLIKKDRLFSLTEFFLKDSREAGACRKLFDQMIRASQQRRWTDAELILSTALEGLLRFLERIPTSDREWDVGQGLSRFREKYLSPQWRIACRQTLAAFERLRHSTAHPDWLVDKMKRGSESERSQSFKDMRLLSRFFGYMILALAGFKDLQPVFGGRLMAADSAPAPSSKPTSEVM
jgi:hypothetical protein